MKTRRFLVSCLALAAVSLPAQAAGEKGRPEFRATFETVLEENYDFMVRELDSLEIRGVIDVGNYSQLDQDQRVAILSYTYSTFYPVNSRLRAGGARAAAIAPYVSVLNSALDRLPRYEGIVLRTVDSLPAAVLAVHQPGAIVTYPAYTSTSKMRSLGTAFNFTIHSHTGADLDGYASNTNEREVLFKPGTRFRVLSRVVRDENTYIELDEVL